MKKQKILLFGSSGYMGNEFLRKMDSYRIVTAPSFKNLKTKKDIASIISFEKASHVINASGFTGKPNVDSCEDFKSECIHGNITYPLWITDVCADKKIPVAHVSSGCIYNGYDKKYTEEDEPDFTFKQNNCSFYSGTKAEFERLAKEYDNALILRLRIPFNSVDGVRNYISKLMTYSKLLSVKNSISHTGEFVNTSYKLLLGDYPKGIYNMTNDDGIEAKEIIEMFRKYRPDISKVFDDKIFFDSLEDFNQTVKAPRSNCVLDTSKLRSFGLQMSNVYDIMEKTVNKYA